MAAPERIPDHGAFELNRLARELEAVTECLPDVVERVYSAAYEHDETSEEQTSFGGGQILRLTSTRRQDWQMARYALAQEYSKVLRTDVRAGIRALLPACKYEARQWSGPPDDFATMFAGRTVLVRPDRSFYWDSRGHHRDTGTMLDAFEERVAEAASAGDVEALRTISEVLAEQPIPGAIWRRLIAAAVREPAQLVRLFGEALATQSLLLDGDLLAPVSVLVAVAFEHLDPDARRLIEDAVISLPETYPADRRELGEERRDQLLGSIPPNQLTTQAAQARAAELQASESVPAPPERFEFEGGWTEISEEENLRERGIEPTHPGTRAYWP